MNDEQLAVLKRVTFLLASVRVFILETPEAMRIADEALTQADKVIKEAEHERTGQHQQLR